MGLLRLRFRGLWKRPSAMSTSTGGSMSPRARATAARPRSRSCRLIPSEAKRRLGWEPTVTFRDLVRIMMDADLEAAGLSAPGQGTQCLTDGRLAWLRKP